MCLPAISANTQALHDDCKKFINIMGAVASLQPTHHMLCHLVHRARFQGNPWFYHNFRDEGYNSVLKRASRYCHQMRYEAAILVRMKYLLARHRGVKRTFGE